ncbi:MAG: TraR/DksA family transcriptional regulator [Proteobacteria bacterium]|nr:TraR/DksA family transcriptional regulator [Pseudomonadota bacterium]
MTGKIDHEAMKARLLAEREATVQEDQAHAENRKVVEVDARFGRLSRMDALQQQAMAEAAHQRATERLRRIDAALKRIEDGEYGYCVSCGEEIGVKRLEADPAIATCIDCASRSEQKG